MDGKVCKPLHDVESNDAMSSCSGAMQSHGPSRSVAVTSETRGECEESLPEILIIERRVEQIEKPSMRVMPVMRLGHRCSIRAVRSANCVCP
jgi:hypothetical protein